jgi:hypothetical protein
MVRFQLIEANENELRYAREGKDATVAYELEGSREAREKGSDGFAKWLKDTKRKILIVRSAALSGTMMRGSEISPAK